MDSLTHNVRRANWLNIINQCQERPANVTVRQWLKHRKYVIIRICQQLYFSDTLFS